MSENITVFGDIADEYDELVAYNEQKLDEWVESTGYATWAMALASGALAFEKFAQGFVDVGRLGNGILKQGGLRGAGNDVMRVLNLAGGATAIAGRVGRLLKVVQASGTATCSWVTATNALRETGQRFFVTMNQLAGTARVNLAQIMQAGTNVQGYQKMMQAFQQMGVVFRQLRPANNMIDEVVNLARANRNGVVTFSIRWTGGTMGHRLYASFSRTAGLVINDTNGTVYRSLAALRRAYPGVTLNATPIIFIENAFLVTAAQAAQRLSEMALLALRVVPMLPVLAGDPETAKQVMDVKKQKNEGTFVPKRFHVVVKDDWLSKLARTYYGDMKKWPVIYEANRSLIGKNPDLILPGQKLCIPELPKAWQN